jgi:hypothetical protein
LEKVPAILYLSPSAKVTLKLYGTDPVDCPGVSAVDEQLKSQVPLTLTLAGLASAGNKIAAPIMRLERNRNIGLLFKESLLGKLQLFNILLTAESYFADQPTVESGVKKHLSGVFPATRNYEH